MLANYRFVVASLLALFIAAALTQAQQTACTFDSPSYSLGSLNGQNGWVATADAGAAVVVSQPRRGGNQAALFNMGLASYDVVADYQCNVSLGAADSVIDVDWDFYYQFGDGFGWNVVINAIDGRPLAWLWVDGGNMWFKTTGAEPLPVGFYLNERSWGHFRASIDWSRHRTTLYVNGQQGAAANFAAATARGVGRFGLASVMGGYTDICGLDEIAVVVRHICRADFNGDGTVDFFDYLDFVDAFSINWPTADFNADGVIDFFDYLDFVDRLSSGC